MKIATAIIISSLLFSLPACQSGGEEKTDNALKTIVVQPKEKARAAGKAADERYEALEEQASELEEDGGAEEER